MLKGPFTVPEDTSAPGGYERLPPGRTRLLGLLGSFPCLKSAENLVIR